MNAFRLLILILMPVGMILTAHAQPANGRDRINGIRAVVQGAVITVAEVEEYIRTTREALALQYRNQPRMYQEHYLTALEKGLEELIERQLVLHDFKSGGYAFPEAIIEDEVEDRIRADFSDDRGRLIKSLQARGNTYEKFRQDLREKVIIEALTYKNVSQEIFISPHKIESYYLAHQDKYKIEDQVKLRMIVLNKNGGTAARARAEEILLKLKEGVAFSEMASVNSDGTQRREGGLWGWVEKSVLRKDLAEVAFGLKAGELSDIIDTPEAVYIMLVEDKRTSHVRPLTELRDEIERELRAEEQARLRKLYIERLRQKSFVLYF